MFWRRRIKVEAATLAKTIFAEFIDKPFYSLPEEVSVTPEAEAALWAKLRLYQYASVLLAVLNEEHTNPDYLSVRVHMERTLLPPTFSQGANMLDEIRSAMKDLGDLLTPIDKPQAMSWAVRWFNSVGIDESNPVRLGMFALHWPSHFTAAAQSLRRFTPIN